MLLHELGMPPLGRTTRWGFKFVKHVDTPLPFQSERWVRLSGVRKLEG
jgi:hypothetical protein